MAQIGSKLGMEHCAYSVCSKHSKVLMTVRSSSFVPFRPFVAICRSAIGSRASHSNADALMCQLYPEQSHTATSGGASRTAQVSWGVDLSSEHERYLTEEVFKQPVIVYDYPKEIKAFYMRLNDDGKTVAAMVHTNPKISGSCGSSFMFCLQIIVLITTVLNPVPRTCWCPRSASSSAAASARSAWMCALNPVGRTYAVVLAA